MSAREDLLDAVATDLESIDGSGSYTYVVAKVERDLVPLSKVQVYPTIIMSAGASRRDQASSHRVFAVMPLTLFCYLKPSGDAVIDTQLNDLEADIKIAMEHPDNELHNGKCHLCLWQESEIVPVVGESVQLIAVECELHYSYQKSTP